MSWFRRSSASDTGAASTAPQNPHLQALKRQARNRLIGMAVLILAGIALFSWVLDTEPRQTEREIVYDIPARGEHLSVRIPAQARSLEASDASGKAKTATTPATLVPANETDSPAQIRARRRAALAEGEELLDAAPLAAGGDEPAPNKAQLAAEQALKAKAAQIEKEKATAAKAAADKLARDKADKAEKAQKAEREQADKLAKEKVQKMQQADKAKADEAARARALLEGKAEPKPEAAAEKKADGKSANSRSVVQFGSFSDAAKATEVRRKVEGAGLKTYTQEIDTPRGKLIRLRVGPFNNPEEADAAAKKIKALGLPSNVLTL